MSFVCEQLLEELNRLHAGSIFHYQEPDDEGEEAGCDDSKRGDLLASLRESYSLTLIDASGLLAQAHPLPFFDNCDAAILVVRAGTTDRALTREALASLERHRVRTLGTVLNDTVQQIPPFLYRLIR
ncbi:MAG: P-loop NTPase family protein [Planctomycetota bacterium]